MYTVRIRVSDRVRVTGKVRVRERIRFRVTVRISNVSITYRRVVNIELLYTRRPCV